VSTVVLKRMHGQTRWDASKSLRQLVQAAAREANAEKALGLLAARYNITDKLILENPFSQEVERYLKSGMAQVEEMKQLRITGSRTVLLEMTTTSLVKPTLLGLLTSTLGTSLNAGMLWFNVYALKAAYNNLQNNDAPEYALGFAASIFGVIGAAAATLVGVRATQKAAFLKLATAMPGMAFGNSLTRLMSSNLSARVFGYPSIALGFLSDSAKAARQWDNGDTKAALYTVAGSIASTIGSVLILEGSLALAGVASLFSLFALVAVSKLLIGAAIIGAGLYLFHKANERLHSPIELWTARGVFGNKINDGELRTNIKLDPNKKLPNYVSTTEEIKEWHASFYSPILLSSEQSERLGLKSLNSAWTTGNYWSPPDWSAIVQNSVHSPISIVEFTVLLKAFVIGQSEWRGELNGTHSDTSKTTLHMETKCYIAPEGLVLNIKAQTNKARSARLEITYQPNHGLIEGAKFISHYDLKA